ncbi:MAG TPA: ABC transporter permease [Candidatus Saccharimonadales bacterium]|nr:ABC transporter permease [Candidatus Saccharimonadales bacterium]
MRFIDYIILAFHNITRQKLRSALTIFAVVIGATSVTIMLALVFSVKGFMTKQFEANGTLQQVRVSPQTDITWQDGGGGNCADCKKLTDDLISKIGVLPHVTGVARQVQIGQFQALSYGSQKLRLYQIMAYDTNGIITNTILAGRDIKATDSSGVAVITSDYADKLGFKGNYQALIGKQVSLIAQNYYSGVGSDPLKQYQEQQAFFSSHPGADGRDFQPTPITLTATVVGIMDVSNQSYAIRVPMDWARGMDESQNFQVTQADQDAANAKCQNTRGPCNSQPQPSLVVNDELAKNGYDNLIVKVDKATNAAAVASSIKHFGVGAVDAQTYIRSQLAIFNIVGIVLGGIGGISLAVAAVGVVNTMVMAILERTREIGVMRAVGAKRSTVSRLFTFEASLLGCLGGVVGVAIGFGLTLIANPIINKQLRGNNIQSSNIVTLPLWLILTVIAATTLIGMLAGLYPARRAAKLDPVEALRYE